MKNNIHLIDSNNFIHMNSADMPQYGRVRDDVPGPGWSELVRLLVRPILAPSACLTIRVYFC